MNILITGAAGFLGSHLSARLVAAGHKVWAVDNLTTGQISKLDPLRDNPNFIFERCGIETPEFMKFCDAADVKFDRVYDLACPTGVPNIQKLGREMIEACSVGTWQVLEVAAKSGADFLLTSSSEIYGEPLVSPQSEEYTGNVDPLGPRANYEEGKRFSETLVKWFADNKGLPAKIVRLFNVYGPNMGLTDTRVVPQFGAQALTGQPLTVHGDGSQSRTLCFVDDILDGFELVISKGVPGNVYNLGSDRSLTMRQLAELIIELTNSSSPIISVPRASHDHSGRMPVLDKIRALGWNEKVDLKDGLSLTLDHFKNRLTVEVQSEPASVTDLSSTPV